MKNGVFTVFKKELLRFFTDKRLLFTSVIMPGLIIYLIYSLMGSSFGNMIDDKTSSFKTAAVNMPESIAAALEEEKFEIDAVSYGKKDEITEKIKENEYALLVIFPEDFEQSISVYDPADAQRATPNVEIYYNSADINSSQGYAQVIAVLDGIEKQLSNVFDVNYLADPTDNIYDLATAEDTTGTLLAMILPMILMTLMFSSCLSLAPESIAGEKERGTIAALLITPTPRSQIILGKILALSVMALLGGLSSFLGTFLSIPTLMESMGEGVETISTDVYGAADYLWLMLLILTTILLLITLISMISAVSKSVKEASTLASPLMIIVVMISVLSMYQDNTEQNIYVFFIPIFNTIRGMTGIFTFNVNPVDLIVCAATNLAVSAVGIFILTKLFDNERVMFSS